MQRRRRARVTHARKQRHARNRQRRQTELRAHVDERARRHAPGQRRYRQSRLQRRADGRHAAAHEHLVPRDIRHIERRDRGRAYGAGTGEQRERQRRAGRPRTFRRGEPDERLLEQRAGVAARRFVGFLTHDYRVEPPLVELRQQLRAQTEMQCDHEAGIVRAQQRKLARELRVGDMLAQAERQPPRVAAERAERALVRAQQIARGTQERVTVGREPHHARRAFEQLAAQMAFEPLELEAHGGLRGVERVGRAREAAQFGDQNEGAHGVEIERFHFKRKWMKYGVISVYYDRRRLS
ncbi:hypothetical protein PT2222_30371 [Paraburkholderia tropica]